VGLYALESAYPVWYGSPHQAATPYSGVGPNVERE